MEFDRDLAIQVGLSVAVIALFVVGLAVISDAYGGDVDVTDEELVGTIEGEYDGDIDDGATTLDFVGTFENDIQVELDGEIVGDIDDDVLTGEFNGTVAGAIDGTATGEVTNGSIDEDLNELDGEFNGTADGTTSMELSDQGGLVLIGLIIAFIIVMPIVGFLIERLRRDEE